MNNPQLANALYGATKPNHCVSCKEPATSFKDSLSSREYAISGLCQVCQDKTFDSETDYDY